MIYSVNTMLISMRNIDLLLILLRPVDLRWSNQCL